MKGGRHLEFWKWCLGQGKPEKVFALVTALKNTLCLEMRVLGRALKEQLGGPGGVSPPSASRQVCLRL